MKRVIARTAAVLGALTTLWVVAGAPILGIPLLSSIEEFVKKLLG